MRRKGKTRSLCGVDESNDEARLENETLPGSRKRKRYTEEHVMMMMRIQEDEWRGRGGSE